MNDIFCQICNHEGLVTYLKEHDIDIDQGDLGEKILKMLEEKDENLKAFEMHITKYKAQNSKNNKIITQLQQKISQLCPNVNNTGSNFMMASQFKDYFDDFMKNCLPTSISTLLPYPEAYAQYVSTLFSGIYEQVSLKISQKLIQICKILSIQTSQQNVNKIRLSLLRTLQQNWKVILLPSSNDDQQPQQQKYLYMENIHQFSNPQIQQIISSQQFRQLQLKLIQICSYMLLQQKKWQFVLPTETKMQKYAKKDYVCIDGWIKEKQDVILILEGLIKENEDGNMVRHPNLKNYVIPYVQVTEEDKYKLIPKEKIQPEQENLSKQSKIEYQKKVTKADQCTQYSPKGITLPLSTKILKLREQQINKENQHTAMNVSTGPQLKSDLSCGSLRKSKNKKIKKQEKYQEQQQLCAQKIQTAIRKLSKGQSKAPQNTIQTDSVSILLSPNMAKGIKNSHQSSNHTLRLHNLQSITDQHITANPSITMVKSSKLKNNSKNSHNLISDPSFQEIITLPQRKRLEVDQLPFKRQTSRAKKSNSRKASAGKIMGQTLECKQNIAGKNNKDESRKQKQNKENINKQVMYKDMIRQKLGTDHKTQRPKQSKQKEKQEDRPLRIMHMKKIREKYLNI